MRRIIQQLFMLPRGIRVRMMSGLALVGVIPILVTVYVITNQLAPVRQAVPWICLVALSSIVLVIAGGHLIRESLMGVINVARSAQELLQEVKKGERGMQELVRLERLLCYMEDQVAAARRALEGYRDELRKEARSWRLPPLIPVSVVRARVKEEVQRARGSGEALGIITWRTRVVSKEELNDDTHIPLWLQEVLRRNGGVIESVGRLRAGYWVGLGRGLLAEQVKELLISMQRIALSHGVQAEIAGWSVPEEEGEVRAWLEQEMREGR